MIGNPAQLPAEALVTHQGLHPGPFLTFLVLLLALSGALFWGANLMLKSLWRMIDQWRRAR
jgi:hypothetical protein